jgi:hypothetical protein
MAQTEATLGTLRAGSATFERHLWKCSPHFSLFVCRFVLRFTCLPPLLPELNRLFVRHWHLLTVHCHPLETQCSLLQQAAQLCSWRSLLHQNLFERLCRVVEDAQVIGDNVSVLAVRTGDQDRAMVVALLRDPVGRTVGAGLACKCHVVRRDFGRFV